MKWIDQAGFACASAWAGRYCVTVYVGGIRFYKPIHIGDIVRVDARLIYTGSSSMHIAIDVFNKGLTEKVFKKATHCIIVFVAVDAEGKVQPVPEWKPSSEKEIAFKNYAVKLMELRKSIEEEMSVYFADEGLAG